MKWKEFFYFTRTERQGIIVLVALIATALAACWFIPPRKAATTTDAAFERELAQFKQSIQEQKNQRRSKYACHRFQQRAVILAPFDPNTTDSVGFLNLGLPPWMAKNILRYRSKGGIFRHPEDFKKVYGLTQEQYATLLPYLSIGEAFSKRDTVRIYSKVPPKDSLQYQQKYPAGTLVSLNQADTTELKKIPHVGSGIARMIIGYRKRLGGFYQIEQLQEIRIKVELLRPWLTIRPNETQRMNLNKTSIERLSRHPYIGFYRAKAIKEYRNKYGNLRSLQQLKLLPEFTPQDIERIEHYVCYE